MISELPNNFLSLPICSLRPSTLCVKLLKSLSTSQTLKYLSVLTIAFPPLCSSDLLTYIIYFTLPLILRLSWALSHNFASSIFTAYANMTWILWTNSINYYSSFIIAIILKKVSQKIFNHIEKVSCKKKKNPPFPTFPPSPQSLQMGSKPEGYTHPQWP